MDITVLFPVLDERLRLRKGIETTVKYLRENSTVPFRLMILDNGSTDETPEIAAQLCAEYKEVEYVRLEQRGVGVAFRKGIELNQSEIVGYMDIDLSTDIKHLGQAIQESRILNILTAHGLANNRIRKDGSGTGKSHRKGFWYY